MSVNTDGTHVIINTCLAYAKHLMASNDKTFIQNAICSKFDLDMIKSARAVLFAFLEPSGPGYRGPSGDKTVSQKSVHAFDCIFTKLSLIDQKSDSPPVEFACPSSELHMLIPDDTSSDPYRHEDRFSKLEECVSDIQRTLTQMVCYPGTVSSIQPTTRQRLMSTTSTSSSPAKRMRVDDEDDEEDDSLSFVSSSSEVRGEEDNAAVYKLPRHQQRKSMHQEKRSQNHAEKKSFAEVSKSAPSRRADAPQIKSKRPSVWGKGEISEDLASTTPDIFLWHCDASSEETRVLNYFKKKEIGVKSVKLASHKDAVYKSFRISVTSDEDYDKIMSGDYLPIRVAVRKYIPPRRSDFTQRSGGSFTDRNSASSRQGTVTVADHAAAVEGLNGLSTSLRNNEASSLNLNHSVDTLLTPNDSSVQQSPAK
jgi:hypothetical protein